MIQKSGYIILSLATMSPAFPPELYREIIGYLSSSRQELLACSLATQYMLAPAQTRLFEAIDLYMEAKPQSDIEVKADRLLVSLLGSPHLRGYIHELELGYHALLYEAIAVILPLIRVKDLSLHARHWIHPEHGLGRRRVRLNSWYQLSPTMRSVLINHTLPQLSYLSIFGVRNIPLDVFLACKQIESLNIWEATFADAFDQNTGLVSAPSLCQLRLVDMFWDTTYSDRLWPFLSSCRDLEIWHEDGQNDNWEIGFHNYSQLFRVCSKSLQYLDLDNWVALGFKFIPKP
ncbi:hypothetical protein DL96DRAFT_720208 [Flagelloscypha sp. PMI_526]|nr:hypothetical protein DL96DRAFT_720208 [Flagelloscypha sp. PMI_526]